MNKILFVIVVLYANVDRARPTQEHQRSNVYDWDVLIFTQQWPETVCKEWVHHNPAHTCEMPKKVDSWSIHGIWPTKFGTRGPEFCNRTWHFDPEQVRPIETQLIDSWTNIEGGTEKYSFWAHEWTKHGTCAAILDPLNSEYKYFSKGLDWGQKYAMATILAQAGIVPDDSKEYSLQDINEVVKKSLGINPSIQCRTDEGKTYLVEIRICFSKNLELHNCDGITTSREVDNYGTIITNCDATQGILYPHNKWPMLIDRRMKVQDENSEGFLAVELYKLISWLQWFTL